MCNFTELSKGLILVKIGTKQGNNYVLNGFVRTIESLVVSNIRFSRVCCFVCLIYHIVGMKITHCCTQTRVMLVTEENIGTVSKGVNNTQNKTSTLLWKRDRTPTSDWRKKKHTQNYTKPLPNTIIRPTPSF